MTAVSEQYLQKLFHFASPNYDPVKAHQYYLRTRKLKGRQSTAGFTQKQKEGLAFVRANVAANKKKQLEKVSATEKSNVVQARQKADAIRASVAEKLRAFKATVDAANVKDKQLTDDVKAKSKAIQLKLADQIAALPPVPKGLSTASRQRLTAQRNAKIALLKGKANADLKQLSSSTADVRLLERTSIQKSRTATQTDASATLQKAAKDLKDTLAKHMANYKAAKAKIEADSKRTLDQQFQFIKSKVR